MLGPHVTFRTPDGTLHRVLAGGIIGRTSAASLRIGDPRVSEAHALVSLRGRELRLIALRGRLQVDGEEEGETVLLCGQHIRLGAAVTIEVVDVVVSENVLAIEIGEDIRELCAEAYSLLAGPPIELVPRLIPGAAAWIWSTNDGWMAREEGKVARRLVAGGSLEIEGGPVRVIRVSLRAEGNNTVGPTQPLRLVCRTTTVHIQRAARPPLTVDARAGQLLSELALMAAPVEWSIMAGLLWPGETDTQKLRRNFDAVLTRLRARLREGGVREDLARVDGRGNVEVFLQPGDVVVDEA